MPRDIGVSKLKNINILIENDIYELACLLLKIYDAKDKETNTTTRSTVFGLFKIYARIAGMDEDQVISIAEHHHLPLGAAVNHDKKKQL